MIRMDTLQGVTMCNYIDYLWYMISSYIIIS